MKTETRLYNIILPIWLLWLFPQAWLIALPGNLLIDCLVLTLALAALKHQNKRAVVRALWWKLWLLGFLADFVGAAFLLPSVFLPEWLDGAARAWVEANLYPIYYNAFLTPWAFLWTLAAVALAGVCIYCFDKRAMKHCALLTQREKHITALALAIVTAPWLFFLPMY